MKKLLYVLLFISSYSLAQNKKISQLPTATTPLAGTELVEIVQGGINKKVASSALGATGGGGTVTSVSGTTNRVTSTGGATPVIDISGSYVGQSSITTLGTISTGTVPGTLVSNTPAGNIAATTAQAAINELDAEKASIIGVFTASGTNTYTVTIPNIAAYASGQVFDIKFTNANTGASTLNVNSIGAVNLRKSVVVALVTGDLIANGAYRVAYDGTNFQILYNFNIGLGASGNFVYSNNLPLQVPSITLSASAGTADVTSPVLAGSGSAALLTTRYSSAADLIGFHVTDNGSSSFGAHNYTIVKISTSNQPFNISTGTAVFKGLEINPSYNMTGGTSTLYDLYINPGEISLTGATHYGIISAGTGNSGLQTITPNSILQVAGSFAAAYVAKTANYTLTGNDHLVNCTANSFTITLPTAVGITGRQYIIKNTGTATVITIATASSQTIDGAVPATLSGLTPMRVMSDGANWITW